MKMTAGPGRQGGMTLLGIVLVLTVIGFGALCAIKVGPLYLDNMTVASVIQSEAGAPDMEKKTQTQVRRSLERRLLVNGLDHLAKEAKIVQSGGQNLLQLNYEKRINFIGNVDVVVVFENSAAF